MVQASQDLVPILVDCSKGGPPDLTQKYGVKGYPTVVFADYQGKVIEPLRSRDAASVKAQMEKIAKEHTVQVLLECSLDEAKAKAKEQGKLLAAVFMDETKKNEGKNALLKAVLLHADLEQVREQLVWVKRPIEGEDGKDTAEARSYKANKTATVVVIDPEAEGDGALDRITDPKKLKKELEKLLAKRAKK